MDWQLMFMYSKLVLLITLIDRLAALLCKFVLRTFSTWCTEKACQLPAALQAMHCIARPYCRACDAINRLQKFASTERLPTINSLRYAYISRLFISIFLVKHFEAILHPTLVNLCLQQDEVPRASRFQCGRCGVVGRIRIRRKCVRIRAPLIFTS